MKAWSERRNEGGGEQDPRAGQDCDAVDKLPSLEAADVAACVERAFTALRRNPGQPRRRAAIPVMVDREIRRQLLVEDFRRRNEKNLVQTWCARSDDAIGRPDEASRLDAEKRERGVEMCVARGFAALCRKAAVPPDIADIGTALDEEIRRQLHLEDFRRKNLARLVQAWRERCKDQLAEEDLPEDQDPDRLGKGLLLKPSDVDQSVQRAFTALRDEPPDSAEIELAVEREIPRELLARRLEKFHARRYEQLVKIWRARFSNLSVEDVEEGIQDTFVNVLKRYLRKDEDPVTVLPTYEDVQWLMADAIRNRLIDRLRKLKFQAGVRRERPFDQDDWMRFRKDLGLIEVEVSPETEVAVKSLLRKVLERLDPKWRELIAMMAGEMTPQEIARAFDLKQTGQAYVLRRWARAKLCKILGEFAAEGDELAAVLHARGCKQSGRKAKRSRLSASGAEAQDVRRARGPPDG